MQNIVIIGPIDPFGTKISGTKNYIMNFLNSIDKKENVILYGYTTMKNVDRPLRYNVKFYPLIVYKEEKENHFIPQTFKFIFKLYMKKRKILSEGRVLHIQRLDHAIPFLFPGKKGKIVIYFHGAASKGYLTGKSLKSKFKGIIYLILEHLVIPRVDKIVTVSSKDEKYYIEKFPLIEEKIVTIPIPINLDKFNVKFDRKELRKKYNLEENCKIILYAGRFSKVKGIDFIIRAFVKLNRNMPNTYLILVGKGEDEKRLRSIALNYNARNVKFIGKLKHDKIPEILNCADVLAMASFTEGMPTIVIEALAVGLPIVSTNVGDLEKLILNEKVGFLIENRNEDIFVDKLIMALGISNRFRDERIQIADNYSAYNISQRILKIHREVAI